MSGRVNGNLTLRFGHGGLTSYDGTTEADTSCDWRSSSGPPPSDAALRERLEAEGYDFFRWSDAPGADYEAHSHDHDESIWLVAGEISFGVGGREYRLRPGDRLMLPAGTVHTARAGAAGATYLIGQR